MCATKVARDGVSRWLFVGGSHGFRLHRNHRFRLIIGSCSSHYVFPGTVRSEVGMSSCLKYEMRNKCAQQQRVIVVLVNIALHGEQLKKVLTSKYLEEFHDI